MNNIIDFCEDHTTDKEKKITSLNGKMNLKNVIGILCFGVMCVLLVMMLIIIDYECYDQRHNNSEYLQCKKLVNDVIAEIIAKNSTIDKNMINILFEKYMNFYGCNDMLSYSFF